MQAGPHWAFRELWSKIHLLCLPPVEIPVILQIFSAWWCICHQSEAPDKGLPCLYYTINSFDFTPSCLLIPTWKVRSSEAQGECCSKGTLKASDRLTGRCVPATGKQVSKMAFTWKNRNREEWLGPGSEIHLACLFMFNESVCSCSVFMYEISCMKFHLHRCFVGR